MSMIGPSLPDHVAVNRLITLSNTSDNQLQSFRTSAAKMSAEFEYAVRNDDVETVVSMLNDGEDVDARTIRGNIALRIAASKGYERMIRVLLQRRAGSKFYHEDQSLLSALPLAAEEGHVECVRLLLDHDADRSGSVEARSAALSMAATFGHTEIVRLLLSHGVPVSGLWGTYPLHRACSGGYFNRNARQVDIVRLLLDHGADINAVNDDRRTPLWFAAKNGKYGMVKFLLDEGALVDPSLSIPRKFTLTKKPASALSAAAGRGGISDVQLLLGHGADVNDFDICAPFRHLERLKGSPPSLGRTRCRRPRTYKRRPKRSAPSHFFRLPKHSRYARSVWGGCQREDDHWTNSTSPCYGLGHGSEGGGDNTYTPSPRSGR